MVIMRSSPASRWGALAILSLASAGWAFSFGLGVPVGALWLKDAGYCEEVVGLATSVYYLGVAGAALVLPWLMRRGSRGLVIGGLLVDAATTALFPWVVGWPLWFFLRLCSGVATAACLIPMETYINHNAPPDSRSRDFSIYAVSVALGIGLGPVVGLQLYPYAPYLAFGLGGLTALLSAILLWWGYPAEEAAPAEESQAPLRWRAHVFSLGTAWFQGFLEGGMLTFMSGYLLGLGYAASAAAGLIGSLFLGVVLFQLPGAWLADRLGRLRVLLACHAVVLLALFVLPFCLGAPGLACWLFVVGAACAFLYPLGLALLGERLTGRELATANAWYLACNCVGSLTGPWLMGRAIDVWGPRSMYAVAIGAGGLVFLAWFLLSPRRSLPGGLPLETGGVAEKRRAA
jgi:MFS family permease